jgi:hypothetical protein
MAKHSESINLPDARKVASQGQDKPWKPFSTNPFRDQAGFGSWS